MTLESLREANPGKNVRFVMWLEYHPEAARKPLCEYTFWITDMWRKYFAEAYGGKEQYSHAGNYDKFHAEFDRWLHGYLEDRKQ